MPSLTTWSMRSGSQPVLLRAVTQARTELAEVSVSDGIFCVAAAYPGRRWRPPVGGRAPAAVAANPQAHLGTPGRVPRGGRVTPDRVPARGATRRVRACRRRPARRGWRCRAAVRPARASRTGVVASLALLALGVSAASYAMGLILKGRGRVRAVHPGRLAAAAAALRCAAADDARPGVAAQRLEAQPSDSCGRRDAGPVPR